ncbi:MAG: hydrogenase maturation protease [Gammaproteobacteria bacterium]|nr:hydrogenase maturation protease [Gammaproteobacteria bacterium]
MIDDKKVVVGFGSFNGDDQAGWLVIDKLSQQCVNDSTIFFKSKADGVDWFPVAEGATEVVFVDAVKSGALPGTVHVIKSQEECANKFSTSSHTINIFDSIALAETLGYLKASYLFFGLEIKDSNQANERVSEEVGSSIRNLVDKLKLKIR